METTTPSPIDHKRVQGIIVFVIGMLIHRFTDWEIATEDLTFGVGEAIYIAGLLYSYFGGMVAEGPIQWFQSDTVKVNPDSVTVIDTSKLSEAEASAFNALMEKTK
jgi:hypothetical protein